MSTYIIGDIHGYYDQFRYLLEKVKFDPCKDTIWITGDLIGRGPNSYQVLEYVFSLKKNAKIVLGNHDFNLILIYYGVHKKVIAKDILDLLNRQNISIFINKLQRSPLVQYDLNKKIIMVHAGVYPKWNLQDLLSVSKEFQKRVSSKNFLTYLRFASGNFPNIWLEKLNKYERFRFIVNAFTRMRYCHFNGELDFSYKDTPPHCNKNLVPWFFVKNDLYEEYSVFFGHWSSLKDTKIPHNIYPLDTGCCWGRDLTLLRWDDKKIFKKKCDITS
ncbi:symmetrical bis(5'-nucleosyl)-tetraphosphatase [Buchnera aphidicola]|uniref:symmetrical bis(5'-nucleosyl)-tetraphosphatase n=1 Tax=Buchnera aphidicola TaxID=9 RepID=UPI00209212AA|nr:symmetrical bis(5'-nucleosyl)-tetraphosphatase [Buchnera aphidicola]USS94230.1 symmetrical bis(5'-nucleosyl)-tetraphosphatase [Buchnera aphidicola (Sipha maydis)]WII23778.1 symmetrical bis(5'-nucleosyl)-tetraphosphatase [Buchnera aphidicola (Sipha maydis)]